MILKGTSKNRPFSILLYLLPVVVVLGIIWNSIDKKNSVTQNNSPGRIIFCDAESVSGSHFKANGEQLSNAKTRSSEKSYSGKYSSKVGDGHKYGMSYTIKNVKPNTKYIATVKRHTNTKKSSALVISGSPGKNLYKKTNVSAKDLGDGWEHLSLDFNITEEMKCTELVIFVTCHTPTHKAYFDDLMIQEINLDAKFHDSLATLQLYLDTKASQKINAKRNEAIEKNILQSTPDDWVKAKLTVGDSLKHDVKLRLKGDWTDHLVGDNWSFRIKMPSDKSWNRLQTFSLQDPKTRYYLHEWIYHKALEKADIITPRYGFVKLYKNDNPPKLYAYEEHFDKQIAEYRNRREGVIVKFAEDHMWEKRLRNDFAENSNLYNNILEHANIVPFKASKTLKSPKLLEQFEHAQDLMHAFKTKSAPASEVFDIDLLAKFLAIADIFNANHGLIWHNMRFYYNPVTRKLEPIGYDGYMEGGPLEIQTALFFGEFMSGNDYTGRNSLYNYFYRDPEFVRAYSPYLIQYSSGDFIDELFNEHNKEMFKITSLIHKYIDSSYAYDKNELRSRALNIYRSIIPYNENTLRIYKEPKATGGNRYVATNLHSLPIEIVGSGSSEEPKNLWEKGQIIYSNTKKNPFTFTEIDVLDEDKYVYFKLPGLDEIYYSTICNWRRPGAPLNATYSKSGEPKVPLDSASFYIGKTDVKILAGKYQLKEPIVIPKGYSLIIESGTEMDFTNRSYLLSYGNVYLNGTKEEPISITSSDKSSQGFTVIQADKESAVNYTSFTYLNTLEENEWQMTGAVTFYESDVNMNTVTVSHNACEDALNIVRSTFAINKLNINNTFADGFDGDFCKGRLVNSYFFDTGNDALDYSGSVIDVRDVRLENIGDKGISAGEQATLTVTDVSITNAQIGIASKDLSKVTAYNINLNDCPLGFAAYRKKPEFGGGNIKVFGYIHENIERMSNSDKESVIKLSEK